MDSGEEMGRLIKTCLCDFPMELLLFILSHLSIVDYLCIRCVCKCWRHAFSNCAKFLATQNSPLKEQWFVLLREEILKPNNNLFPRPSLFTTGRLGNLLTGRVYNNVPQLCDTRIELLLSRHGWLLLFCHEQQHLFFFDPFSNARISLPFLDLLKLRLPVFEISTAPTCSNCIVFVISLTDETTGFEINTCKRGSSVWTTKKCKVSHAQADRVSNVIFAKGIFYCLHLCGLFLFSDVKADGMNYAWPSNLPNSPYTCYRWGRNGVVSYARKDEDDDKLYLCMHSIDDMVIELKDRSWSSRQRARSGWFFELPCTKFAEDWAAKFRFRLKEEGLLLAIDNPHLFRMSTFNMQAWCGSFAKACTATDDNKVDGIQMTSFYWHGYGRIFDRGEETKKRCLQQIEFGSEDCEQVKYCDARVAWLEPTWVDYSSTDLDWSYMPA